jgi:hypothetical protein
MKLSIIPLLAALVISSACRSDVDHMVNPKPGVAAETSTTSGQQFNDIPTPDGYQLVNDRLQSYVTEAGSYRAGHQYYSGKGMPLDAVSFYENRMPNHGWVLADRGTSADGLSFMLWRKGATFARIEIQRNAKTDLVGIEVRVRTSLDPEFRPL